MEGVNNLRTLHLRICNLAKRTGGERDWAARVGDDSVGGLWGFLARHTQLPNFHIHPVTDTCPGPLTMPVKWLLWPESHEKKTVSDLPAPTAQTPFPSSLISYSAPLCPQLWPYCLLAIPQTFQDSGTPYLLLPLPGP